MGESTEGFAQQFVSIATGFLGALLVLPASAAVLVFFGGPASLMSEMMYWDPMLVGLPIVVFQSWVYTRVYAVVRAFWARAGLVGISLSWAQWRGELVLHFVVMVLVCGSLLFSIGIPLVLQELHISFPGSRSVWLLYGLMATQVWIVKKTPVMREKPPLLQAEITRERTLETLDKSRLDLRLSCVFLALVAALAQFDLGRGMMVSSLAFLYLAFGWLLPLQLVSWVRDRTAKSLPVTLVAVLVAGTVYFALLLGLTWLNDQAGFLHPLLDSTDHGGRYG